MNEIYVNLGIYFLGVVVFWILMVIENNLTDGENTVEDVLTFSLLSWVLVIVYTVVVIFHVVSSVISKWYKSVKDKPFGKIPKKVKPVDDDVDWHLKKIKITDNSI